MHDVTEIDLGVVCKTRVWMTVKAGKSFRKFRRKCDPDHSFTKQLQRCAKNGFELHEHGDWPQVKHEWDDAYRFGCRQSLFRLIGFYTDGAKSEFVVIDAFLKGGQKLSEAEKERVTAVAKVKKKNLWRRVYEKGLPRNP